MGCVLTLRTPLWIIVGMWQNARIHGLTYLRIAYKWWTFVTNGAEPYCSLTNDRRSETSVRLMKPSAWIQIWDDRHWATAIRKIRRKPEMSTHIANCTCIYNGVHMQSKLQRTGTRLAAECPHCCLCHRSAVFFRHVYVTALSRHTFRKYCFSFVYLLIGAESFLRS